MMMFIAQRMPEEPWHLVLRSDEGGWLTAVCGEPSLPYGWWKRTVRPVERDEVPEGLCADCRAAIQQALDAGLDAVAEVLARLDDTLQSVQAPPPNEPGVS